MGRMKWMLNSFKGHCTELRRAIGWSTEQVAS